MKRLKFFVGIGIAAGLCLLGLFIQPDRLEVHHLWLNQSPFDKTLEGKIAIHLTDLHIDKLGKLEGEILKTIHEIKPDFIFLTGDYVKWEGDYEDALIFLSKLKARIGVWAVMGDYDYSRSRKSCLFCHERGGGKPTHRHQATFLRNRIERIPFGNGSLLIGGIDDFGDENEFSKESFFASNGGELAIFLSHDPLNFKFLDERQDALMLSGDTHGGQIPLPSWLWGLLGYDKTALYEQGLFKKGRKMMFVSRGVGYSHLPIRISRRPEIVVFHF